MENLCGTGLSTIQSMGNVTVFRTGRPLDATWGYGYRHLIVFDKLTTYNRSASASVSLYCAGSKGGCGCLDPTAAFVLSGDNRYSHMITVYAYICACLCHST